MLNRETQMPTLGVYTPPASAPLGASQAIIARSRRCSGGSCFVVLMSGFCLLVSRVLKSGAAEQLYVGDLENHSP